MTPVLVSLDPTKLREQLQSDPTLQALLARGYTVGTSCVLVSGGDGPEQVSQFALVLMPPGPALSTTLSVPRWLVALAVGVAVALAWLVAATTYAAVAAR